MKIKTIYDPRYIELINHLKQVRKARHISQSAIAEILGIDRTLVTKTETFVRRLDIVELYDWLDALDYTLEDFLKEIGSFKYSP